MTRILCKLAVTLAGLFAMSSAAQAQTTSDIVDLVNPAQQVCQPRFSATAPFDVSQTGIKNTGSGDNFVACGIDLDPMWDLFVQIGAETHTDKRITLGEVLAQGSTTTILCAMTLRDHNGTALKSFTTSNSGVTWSPVLPTNPSISIPNVLPTTPYGYKYHLTLGCTLPAGVELRRLKVRYFVSG